MPRTGKTRFPPASPARYARTCGCWRDGTWASSDGQHFFAGGPGEATAEVNARHGNQPGVSCYTHVSDQYGP